MIHFGDFNLKNVSPKEILNIISQPSNILNKNNYSRRLVKKRFRSRIV